MAREQKRISVDPVLWDAVEAAAKAKGVPLHAYVEEALRVALDPFETIRMAARAASEMQANATSMADRINVLADFIVDAHQSESGR